MAQTLDQQIEARVRPLVEERVKAFVDELSGELTVLVRKAAADVLAGGEASPRRGGRAKGRAGKSARNGRRVRRSPKQLEQTAGKLKAYIAKNPGQRMEQIGEALGATTRELRRPLQQLIDEGAVRREGQKRASKYFAGGRGKRKNGSKRAGKPSRRR